MKNIIHVFICALLVFIGSTLAANEEGILINGDRLIVDNDGAWVYDGTGDQFEEDRNIQFDHSKFEWGDSLSKIKEIENNQPDDFYKNETRIRYWYFMKRKTINASYAFTKEKLDFISFNFMLFPAYLSPEDENRSTDFIPLKNGLISKYGEPLNLDENQDSVEFKSLRKKFAGHLTEDKKDAIIKLKKGEELLLWKTNDSVIFWYKSKFGYFFEKKYHVSLYFFNPETFYAKPPAQAPPAETPANEPSSLTPEPETSHSEASE